MATIGHPFDTLKTRMQASNIHPSTWHCAKEMVKHEGVRGFFKGLPASLWLTALTSGIRFGCQASFNAWLARQLGRSDFRDFSLVTRVATEAAGGFVAGLALPFIFTPLELVRARQQVCTNRSLGAIQIVRGVWHDEGLRGLYKGHSMTMMRSTIGNAALFGSYELFKHTAAVTTAPVDANTGVRGETPRGSLLVAGVLAGWTSWFTCFPLDSVKTRLQVLQGGTIGSTFRQLVAERALWKGMGPVLARAVPVHAAYLPVYDFVMQYLFGGRA